MPIALFTVHTSLSYIIISITIGSSFIILQTYRSTPKPIVAFMNK